jgi:hypothetical protein
MSVEDHIGLHVVRVENYFSIVMGNLHLKLFQRITNILRKLSKASINVIVDNYVHFGYIMLILRILRSFMNYLMACINSLIYASNKSIHIMSLYYKGLPAHMKAYMSERELEGFLGRLQSLKNKVVMQAEINNEDVGERLAQLEELKRAALERRAANKQPKVGQVGMSESDKKLIEAQRNRNNQRDSFIKNILEGVIDTATSETKPSIQTKRGRGNPNLQNPEYAAQAGREGGKRSAETRKKKA